MNIELTANECIILAALCNREISDLKEKRLMYSSEECSTINLYKNLRNKIIK